MKDLNHASSDPFPRMPMARPMSGSPDMLTYRGGIACTSSGRNCFGHIAWQSINSVAGMWTYFQKKNLIWKNGGNFGVLYWIGEWGGRGSSYRKDTYQEENKVKEIDRSRSQRSTSGHLVRRGPRETRRQIVIWKRESENQGGLRLVMTDSCSHCGRWCPDGAK